VLRSTALALAVLCAAVPASANKPSNPAFLGIGMNDLGGGVRGVGPCTIVSIEVGSGAEAAMLQPGDVLERVDARPIPNCTALTEVITSKTPGTVIQVEVRRRAQSLKVKAELLTRDEILRRRLVGQPLPAVEALRVEDGELVDLGAVKRTTIIGWYPMSCAGCDTLVSAVARWGRERAARRAPVGVVAAVADVSLHRSATESLEQLRLVQRSLDAPLFAVDFETYSKFAMRDHDRVHFVVIDSRGVVQHVAPIMPDAEDSAALLDELYAAAEQTARRSSR